MAAESLLYGCGPFCSVRRIRREAIWQKSKAAKERSKFLSAEKVLALKERKHCKVSLLLCQLNHLLL